MCETGGNQVFAFMDENGQTVDRRVANGTELFVECTRKFPKQNITVTCLYGEFPSLNKFDCSEY